MGPVLNTLQGCRQFFRTRGASKVKDKGTAIRLKWEGAGGTEEKIFFKIQEV